MASRAFTTLTDQLPTLPLDPAPIDYRSHTPKVGRNAWPRIREAYTHDEGAGITVLLHAVPSDAELVLLQRDDSDDQRLAARAERVAQP